MITRRRFLAAGTVCVATAQAPLSAAGSWQPIRSSGYLTINGITYQAQCGPLPIAIQRSAAGVLRFTMVPGNKWEKDSANSERAEIAGWKSWLSGKLPIWTAWSMYYEAGDWSTSDWCIVHQVYHLRGAPLAHVLKPRGVLQWVGVDVSEPRGRSLTRHRQVIEQGTWINFVEVYKFAPETGDGYWRSWVNGKQVLDLKGALGSRGSPGCYAKFGIYRDRFQTRNAAENRPGDQVSEQLSIRYANLRFTEDDLSHLIEKPDPTPAWEQWS